MPALDECTFRIPSLWEGNWTVAIEEAEGVERQLLSYQRRAAELLRDISDPAVTPERLAWFGFWTKAFAGLEGALAGLEQQAWYPLEMLARAAFESVLHLAVVIEPIHSEEWDEVMDRMVGYAAWSLWNDRECYKETLDREVMDAVWDPEPAQGIREDEHKREAYEALFGSLDVEAGPAELKRQRLDHEEWLFGRLDNIENWLSHPRLALWQDRVKKVGRRSPFALFNTTESDVFRRLESQGMRFAYEDYRKRSKIMHGSTLEQLVWITEKAVTPRFKGLSSDVEGLADLVGFHCNHILVGLALIKAHVW